jgi:outer membrane protein W
MNAKFLFLGTLAIAAAAASTLARADEADASQFVIKAESTRTRAEVTAEAAKVSATRSTEPNGSRVIQAPTSGLAVQTVRAEAVQALRLGKIPSGEASF